MRKTLVLIALGLFLGANISQACDGDKAKAMKSGDKSCCSKMASVKKECTDAEKKACTSKASKMSKTSGAKAEVAIKKDINKKS